MKNTLAIIALTILLAGSPISSYADSNLSNNQIDIKIDGQTQNFDQKPIIVNDLTLVPMRRIFETLGAEVKWEAASNKITAFKENDIIILTIGSNMASRNGSTIMLNSEPLLNNGVTVVPLRFISESLGATVSWDEESKTILINTNNGNKALPSNSNIETSNESVIASKELTFDEAVDLLIKNNPQIKNASKDIEYADEIKGKAEDKVEYIPFIYTGNDVNSAANKIWYGYQQSNLSYEMSKRNYQVVTDKLVYSLREAYNSILNKEEQLKVAKMSLENVKWQNQLVNTKLRNGMVSDFDQTTSETAVKELAHKIEALNKDLETAYQNLNKLIGLNPDARYNLVDTIAYSQLKDIDLDHYIARVMDSSTAVWLAESKISLKELEENLYTYNDPSNIETLDAKKINIEKAELSAADTKIQLKNLIRTIYNNIKALEEQYAIYEVNLEKAKQGLEIIKTKYDVGMATSAEVFDAQTKVEDLEAKIFDTVVKIDNLKIAFEKPWVLAN